MKFGYMDNLAYGIIVAAGAYFIGSGILKKKRIVEGLHLGSLRKREYAKGMLMVLGSALVFLALLGPQKLESEEEVKTEGLSIYILMDISRSMLAEDVYPSRIEAAKSGVEQVIGELTGDRVGIIPFSEGAYIQMPLTDDYSIAKNYIQVIDTKLISGGGTNIMEGLKLANNSFDEIGSTNKVVLIISDGGDRNEGAVDFALKNNMRIYTMGVGTHKGSVLPLYEGGVKKGFVTDSAGNTVVSSLNEGFLKELSQKTGGRYYRLDNISRGGEGFAEEIANLKGEELSSKPMKIYAHYYQIPLLIGMILILLGVAVKGGIRDEED